MASLDNTGQKVRMTSVEMKKKTIVQQKLHTHHTATIDIVLPYTEVGTKHQKSQKIQKSSNLNKGRGGYLVAILDHYVVAILNYYWLPTGTTHLVEDNSEVESVLPIFSRW